MDILSTLKTKSSILQEILLALGGVALLFATSQIEIPLKPVPINLQTVAVMLIGLTYTPRRALESHLIWLGLAAAGAPVLSGFAGGLSYLGGSTLGYLIGFVVSAYLMATLKEKLSLSSWKSDVMLCLIGTLVVFTFGVGRLSLLIGLPSALMHGLLPFILPGIIKAGLLCTALQIVRHYRRG